jgi:replicative DNA helicase
MATKATQNTGTPKLPGDEQIERALLGAALLDRGNFYTAAERLEPGMFYSAAHRRIFQAMLDLGQAGVQVNIATVAEKVDGDAAVEGAGGSPYIAALVDGTPAVADIEHYSKIIHGHAEKRRLALEGELITERALDPTTTPDELLESIETTIGEIREDQLARTRTAMPIKEAVRETLPSLERSGQGEGAMIGRATGYSDLDKKIAGWIPGDLVVVAARPSAGKTALVLEFARHQAEEGNATLIFSFEMSRVSLVQRLACRRADINLHKFRSGYLAREEQARLLVAMGKVSEYPIWVADPPSMQATEIRWKIRTLAQRIKPALVIVDYLQLLRAKAENRTQAVTEISMQLKASARELGEICKGTLIAVSQLVRIPGGERPQLHHLRESGQIEQDADTVLLLSDQGDVELGQTVPWTKILDVAKQRNGPTGLVRFTFFPGVMGFEQPAAWRKEPDE